MVEKAQTIEASTELETLFPASLTVELEGQESVTVSPLTVKQTAHVAKAIRAILAAQAGELGTVQELLLNHATEMVQIVAVASNKSEEWVGSLRADLGLKLAVAVFEVNVPFFMYQVVPLLGSAALRITSLIGPTTSNDSESTDMPSPRTTPKLQ